ncbi:MAG: 23S rRNA (adenine(2503)-C(2))-methyltransferase RlmN [Phycisphaerales bacterium]|nr:23S rRNA (adenine(2503)-C(2))-methyltransferase RlmN [Phycisphaerales bacterium]
MSSHKSFFDYTPVELEQWCLSQGLPGYAADQFLDWVYVKGVVNPLEWTNVSLSHRQLVSQSMQIDSGHEVQAQIASDDTRKLLIEWPAQSTSLAIAGEAPRTETVLIPSGQRRTACLSSQVGCPVGCRFCASGLGGLDGNLRRGQIVEQAHRLGRLGMGRVTNIVFMGMGEPLANYSAVTGAIETLNAPWGLGISARRITVSTVGLPEAIRRLAGFHLPVTLALSLHAPDDAIRQSLIPWASHATIDELIEACGVYFDQTGREITLEYLLLREVNDRLMHASQLAEIAQTIRANVNLIRYNEVEGLEFKRPLDEDVLAFQAELRRRHVNVHIRASRGRDISAACGQLRHEARHSA